MNLHRPHHQAILDLLRQFNSAYFAQHAILFGGGTRIALELFEYRESIDIDFLCADPSSYKAVRSQVTSEGLGELLGNDKSLSFPRGVRADRDAVRTFVQWQDVTIKLEFVHFDYYNIERDARYELFPIPFIDRNACFLTKLLANADRYAEGSKKDIFDLCMMAHHWGGIPANAWAEADAKYGLAPVYSGLMKALDAIEGDKSNAKKIAIESLKVNSTTADRIVSSYAPGLRAIVQRAMKS